MLRFSFTALSLFTLTAGLRGATVFTDIGSFAAATQGLPCQENFDGLSLGAQPFGFLAGCVALPFPFTANALPLGNIIGVPGGGIGPLDHAVAALTTLTLNLNDGPTAIGGLFWLVDGTTTQVAGGQLNLSLSDGTNTTVTISPLNQYAFVGFVGSTPLTSLVLSGPGAFAAVADNVMIGTAAVPEPAAVTTVALGLAALAGFQIRRLRGRRSSAPNH